MIVLKFSYHCYSEATRFSHAYIFSPRCKIPHSFENFYNFIYQTTLLSRISCDTISTQNRKLFTGDGVCDEGGDALLGHDVGKQGGSTDDEQCVCSYPAYPVIRYPHKIVNYSVPS